MSMSFFRDILSYLLHGGTTAQCHHTREPTYHSAFWLLGHQTCTCSSQYAWLLLPSKYLKADNCMILQQIREASSLQEYKEVLAEIDEAERMPWQTWRYAH